jgi:transposase
MRPHGSPQQLEHRRQQAIVWLTGGETFRAVAGRLGASLSSVVRWCQAYRQKGRQGLKARPTPGRPCRLSPRQKAHLEARLLRGAQAVGYATELWTLRRIGRLIEQEFGVRYSPSAVWRLLVVDLGWSAQKPERRATQRDEAAIARWKRRSWPRIKKSPVPGSTLGFRGRNWVPAHSQRP